MTLTITGAAILLLSVVAFLRSSFALFLLVIISIPFSATAVFNIAEKDSNSGTGISFTLVVLLLYLFRRFLEVLLKGRTIILGRFSLGLFFVFLASMALSLAVPLLNSGKTFQAVDPFGAIEATYTVALDVEHIIQWGYFALWGLFLLLAGKDIADTKQLILVMRTMLYTGIFVCIWGWMQLIVSMLGLPYPYQVFNNTLSGSGHGYRQIVEGVGISRMSSVSVEPSFFSAYLLVLLSLLLGFIILGVPVIGKYRDLWLAGLFAVTAASSTAATAYSGLGFIGLLGFFAILWARKQLLSRLILVLVGVLGTIFVVGMLYLSVPLVQNITNSFLLNRTDSFSFSIRFQSLVFALHSFTNFPLLGLGVNSMTVYSLPFWLIANGGLLGLFTFIAAYLSLFRYPLTILGDTMAPSFVKGLGVGVVLALSTLLFITTLTGFPYNYGHFWLPILLALAVAPYKRSRAHKHHVSVK